MLHSDVLVETKPYIHAMKQNVIKLMGIGYFQCKSGSITCTTFGAVARNPNPSTQQRTGVKM